MKIKNTTTAVEQTTETIYMVPDEDGGFRVLKRSLNFYYCIELDFSCILKNVAGPACEQTVLPKLCFMRGSWVFHGGEKGWGQRHLKPWLNYECVFVSCNLPAPAPHPPGTCIHQSVLWIFQKVYRKPDPQTHLATERGTMPRSRGSLPLLSGSDFRGAPGV